MKTKVAIVTGGVSGERDISIKSANTIHKNLVPERYEVTVFNLPADRILFSQAIQGFDIVIPVIHGKGGEDGEITAHCEAQGVPCFFTTADSHKLCIDKFFCTEFIKQCGFCVPETHLCNSLDSIPALSHDKVFVKPVNGGSSIDSGICNTPEEMKGLIEKILEYDMALIQQYVTGREFTVSISGEGEKAKVLAISEIITSQEFFDYDAKYNLLNTSEHTPADIKPALKKKIENVALDIYRACNMSCLGRIDFIYDTQQDRLYFLEINTIPGFTETSFFPQAILHSGHTLHGFLHQKIQKYLVPAIDAPHGRTGVIQKKTMNK